MGEKQSQPFQFTFNTSTKIVFKDSRVTSDGGMILVRELDECHPTLVIPAREWHNA